jgi:hypothetical protein
MALREEQEIKDKILALYNAREKFTKIVNDERKKSTELNAAFKMVECVYTEKINALNWVLKLNEEILMEEKKENHA